tara:strand:+ start:150 stop:464 length:315 start_codon:yes stop_codon:yes gene_type:complete
MLRVMQVRTLSAAMVAMVSKAHSLAVRPITAVVVAVVLSSQAALLALAVKAVVVMLGRLVLKVQRVRARMARPTPAVAVAVTLITMVCTAGRVRLLAAVVVRGL